LRVNRNNGVKFVKKGLSFQNYPEFKTEYLKLKTRVKGSLYFYFPKSNCKRKKFQDL
jgi:hypothetical protein